MIRNLVTGIEYRVHNPEQHAAAYTQTDDVPLKVKDHEAPPPHLTEMQNQTLHNPLSDCRTGLCPRIEVDFIEFSYHI